MISDDEKGPFSSEERLQILKSLHTKSESSPTTELQEISDINKKLLSEEDLSYKKKFMVYQWFNKVKYNGSKVKLPLFSFCDMVGNGCVNEGLPMKIKSNCICFNLKKYIMLI
jgi:hypothetical protein